MLIFKAQAEQLRELSPVIPKSECEIIEVIAERKAAGEVTPSSPSAASSSSSGRYEKTKLHYSVKTCVYYILADL
jgi:hypothetical protein